MEPQGLAVLTWTCVPALVVPVIVPRWRHVRLPKHAVLTRSCGPTLVVPVIVPTSVCAYRPDLGPLDTLWQPG